jgi:hypothetical protein
MEISAIFESKHDFDAEWSSGEVDNTVRPQNADHCPDCGDLFNSMGQTAAPSLPFVGRISYGMTDKVEAPQGVSVSGLSVGKRGISPTTNPPRLVWSHRRCGIAKAIPIPAAPGRFRYSRLKEAGFDPGCYGV